MKIFVTVGTTQFDALIEYLDSHLPKDYEVLFQIANGEYKPKNFKFITYTDKIDALYQEYDYIITHAGAGTIYKLLDLHKKMIVVPNLDRIDKHQIDIANYMEKNNHVISCIEYSDIPDALKKLPTIKLDLYKKNSFFMSNEICDYIQNEFDD